MSKRFATLCLFAAALCAFALPARASDDAVQFGRNIHVAAGEQVGDAVCIFCSVSVEGKVTGDIVAILGSVHLAGDAQHDLVNIFGSVRAEPDASVEGDLVGVFSSVRLDERVSIGKDLSVILGSLRTAGSVALNGDRTFIPGYVFFLPLGILMLIVYIIVHEIRSQRQRRAMRGFPMPPVG